MKTASITNLRKKIRQAQSVSLHRRGGFVDDYILFASSSAVSDCQWLTTQGSFCNRGVPLTSNHPYCPWHLSKATISKISSKEVVEWVEFTVGRLDPNDYS